MPGRSSPARCIARRGRTTTSEHGRQLAGSGRDQGRELAQRMAGGPDEGAALVLEHAERRDVAGKQRRLHELGRREQLLVVASGHDFASQGLGGFGDDRSTGRMGGPRIGHARELGALPGKYDGLCEVDVVHPHRLPRGERSC